jgi:hypothetical protein
VADQGAVEFKVEQIVTLRSEHEYEHQNDGLRDLALAELLAVLGGVLGQPRARAQAGSPPGSVSIGDSVSPPTSTSPAAGSRC